MSVESDDRIGTLVSAPLTLTTGQTAAASLAMALLFATTIASLHSDGWFRYPAPLESFVKRPMGGVGGGYRGGPGGRGGSGASGAFEMDFPAPPGSASSNSPAGMPSSAPQGAPSGGPPPGSPNMGPPGYQNMTPPGWPPPGSQQMPGQMPGPMPSNSGTPSGWYAPPPGIGTPPAPAG